MHHSIVKHSKTEGGGSNTLCTSWLNIRDDYYWKSLIHEELLPLIEACEKLVATVFIYLTFDQCRRMLGPVYFSCKTTRISCALQQRRKSFPEGNRWGIRPAVDWTHQQRPLLVVDHGTWMARNETHSQCRIKTNTGNKRYETLFDITLKNPAFVFKTHFNRHTNERSLFTSFPVNIRVNMISMSQMCGPGWVVFHNKASCPCLCLNCLKRDLKCGGPV